LYGSWDLSISKIVPFGPTSKARQKAGRVIKKDLKEMGTSWEGVKREALNRLMEEERA